MARIYPDLERLAMHCQWGSELSARPSDLVQETFLRLARQEHTVWNDRAHFFAVAARLIRRAVVDEVRFRGALKRSAGDPARGWDQEVAGEAGGLDLEVLALHQALERLARTSPSAARVVELRYFAGLSVDEIAELLDVARSTVKRRWRFARAWLQLELVGEAPT